MKVTLHESKNMRKKKKKKKTRAPKAYTPEMAVYARVCARVCTHSQVTS